ncbi:MAG: heavy-metal-associated domain-containing protein [Trichococcus flocculiformis]|jgi:copper ion binding protein|uniref:Heavy-metal-associated domain-containing protein n=2 Tax=Trichococcus TaxID=82802 RepID=A0A847D6L9_9LACT|nr:heavy-metal-associated domain-containing protein [Trichococcus flocculiformis]MBP6165517.1 heavy-metal-associated domain-containing protein [Trichococcus sp.]MBP6246822.1 heavy-metal-associated domain-containing protein [Trichococcus sp.]MBP8682682.1 heavy-metal-associated domain-containing protein [Trichococcus sp.]NLD32543.1 heavy-metal-associated domain-containing protein [Trichococcus flocculiformis]HBQ63266.1 heavy metal-binding protein [Trichococcus sp.]
MSQAVIQLGPVTCPSCIKKIEAAVSKIEGVETVKVLFNSSKVKAAFDSNKTSGNAISETIQKLGYEVQSVKES